MFYLQQSIDDALGSPQTTVQRSIDDVLGRPSSVVIHRAARRVAMAARRHRTATVNYRQILEARERQALDALGKSLPAPRVAVAATQQAVTEHVIAAPAPELRVTHLQTVSTRFVDPQDRPLAGLVVTPSVQAKDEPSKCLPPITTDENGRAILKGLTQVPGTVEFHLPKSSSPSLPDEWRFHDPSKACVVLDTFSGKTSRLARHHLDGVRLASTGLSGLLSASIGVAGRGPSNAERKAAIALAQKAHASLDLARSLLRNRAIDDPALPAEVRDQARRLLREAQSFAEQSVRHDRMLAQAYQYRAEALWFTGDHQRAIQVLSQARRSFPRDHGIAAQLDNYNGLAGGTPSPPVPPTPPKRPSAPREITVEHAIETEPVTLERAVVDLTLTMPPGADGARVYWPKPEPEKAQPQAPASDAEEELRVDKGGHVRLPADLFSAGPIPLHIVKATKEAQLETVVDEYTAPDPYASTNSVTVPPLRAVRIPDVQLPNDLDVLMPQATAERLLPQARRQVSATGDEVGGNATGDGSWWLAAPEKGVALRMRHLPTRAPAVSRSHENHADRHRREEPAAQPAIVEAIRLTARDSGAVGGVRVGDDVATMWASLGTPDTDDPTASEYLDGGVRFLSEAGKVTAIEVLRPARLLREGTTAFVRRKAANVFVESFATTPGRQIGDRAAFERYLERTGVVHLVRQKEDADLVLSARMEDFKEEREQLMGTVPLKYICSGDLVYSLSDATTQRWLAQDEHLQLVRRADWVADFGKVMFTSRILALLLNKASGRHDIGSAIAGIVGAASMQRLRQSMQRAVRRTPLLVEQGLYNELTDKLYAAVDFSGRVTAIDYRSGEISINLGSADGIAARGADEAGTHLDLAIGRRPLPAVEDGLNADFYTLEAITAGEHESKCVIVHVVRTLEGQGIKEKLTAEEDREMVRRIPQPRVGVLAVSIHNRLLPIKEQE